MRRDRLDYGGLTLLLVVTLSLLMLWMLGTPGALGETLTAYTVTAEHGLRLRSEPGTDAEALRSIPFGTVVAVEEVRGRWARTIYDGKVGWVCTDFIEPVEVKAAE